MAVKSSKGSWPSQEIVLRGQLERREAQLSRQAELLFAYRTLAEVARRELADLRANVPNTRKALQAVEEVEGRQLRSRKSREGRSLFGR